MSIGVQKGPGIGMQKAPLCGDHRGPAFINVVISQGSARKPQQFRWQS